MIAEQDTANSMRLFSSPDNIPEVAPAGSRIYRLIPDDINVATAYKFNINVYYNSLEPTLMVTLAGGPFELIVGCLQQNCRAPLNPYYFELFEG